MALFKCWPTNYRCLQDTSNHIRVTISMTVFPRDLVAPLSFFSSRYLGRENKRPEVQLNATCVSIAEGVSPARQDLSVAKTKLKQQLISTEIKSQGTCKLQAVLLSLLRGPLYSFVVVVFFSLLLLNDFVLASRHSTHCIQVR